MMEWLRSMLEKSFIFGSSKKRLWSKRMVVVETVAVKLVEVYQHMTLQLLRWLLAWLVVAEGCEVVVCKVEVMLSSICSG